MIDSDMLKRTNVQILDGAQDWKEAIALCTRPLLQQGYITQRYIDTVIALTEKSGAYYLLIPAVALIHARPEDGVLKRQMAVTLLKNPVLFTGKTIPTKLLIALAATDSESHLDALSQIANVLADDKKMDKLLKAQDTDTLYTLITSE